MKNKIKKHTKQTEIHSENLSSDANINTKVKGEEKKTE